MSAAARRRAPAKQGAGFVPNAWWPGMTDPDALARAHNLVESGPHPHLLAGDAELLAGLLLSGMTSYLEFGAGGSTALALRSAAFGGDVERIVSVEGSSGFLEANLDSIYSALAESEPGRRLPSVHSIVPALGPLAEWAHPTDPETFGSWYPTYAQSVDLVPFTPDVVFVDGRFRVASVLHAIRRWGAHPVIVLDDFDQRRGFYGDVLEFCRVIEGTPVTADASADATRYRALFVRSLPAAELDSEALTAALARYERDPQ